jgi:MFS transporter, Spinster family, sphingosine-1-phosphate transporter
MPIARAEDVRSLGRAYKQYLLAMLMVVLALNQVDRFALGLLLQNIKLDLKLTDTQLGFLSGIACSLFYALMGVPIARWSDRGNRVTVLSVTCAFWSIAVACSGLVFGFFQLLLTRVLAGIGEAGCMPVSHSLIADEFEPHERPRAIGQFLLGVPIALTFGYLGAGWVNQLYGWRTAFFVIGLPGVVVALIAAVTLREPRLNANARARSTTETAPMSAMASLSLLWRNRALRHLLFCFSVWYFFAFGILQWMPAFFIRSHGMKTGELGIWFAVIWGVGGGIGVYSGGVFAAWWAGGNERRQLMGAAYAFVSFALLMTAAFAVRNAQMAFGLLGLAAIGGNMAQAPMLATVQSLVPPSMRAMAIAVIYFFANLMGYGLGPLATGSLSDMLHPFLGEESLRWALICMCPGYLWAAWHLQRAARAIPRQSVPAIANDPTIF